MIDYGKIIKGFCIVLIVTLGTILLETILGGLWSCRKWVIFFFNSYNYCNFVAHF